MRPHTRYESESEDYPEGAVFAPHFNSLLRNCDHASPSKLVEDVLHDIHCIGTSYDAAFIPDSHGIQNSTWQAIAGIHPGIRRVFSEGIIRILTRSESDLVSIANSQVSRGNIPQNLGMDVHYLDSSCIETATFLEETKPFKVLYDPNDIRLAEYASKLLENRHVREKYDLDSPARWQLSELAVKTYEDQGHLFAADAFNFARDERHNRLSRNLMEQDVISHQTFWTSIHGIALLNLLAIPVLVPSQSRDYAGLLEILTRCHPEAAMQGDFEILCAFIGNPARLYPRETLRDFDRIFHCRNSQHFHRVQSYRPRVIEAIRNAVKLLDQEFTDPISEHAILERIDEHEPRLLKNFFNASINYLGFVSEIYGIHATTIPGNDGYIEQRRQQLEAYVSARQTSFSTRLAGWQQTTGVLTSMAYLVGNPEYFGILTAIIVLITGGGSLVDFVRTKRFLRAPQDELSRIQSASGMFASANEEELIRRRKPKPR